jgi:hypothetical protein
MSYLGCSVRLLPLVVYWRAHVLFRMFGSSFTSRCLLEGSCLINDVWFVFYLQLFIGGLMSYLGCSVRLLPLVVYWRAHVLFRMFGSSFTSRCLLEASCLI